MATSQMSGVIQYLHRAVLLRDGAGLTDGQLLEDYLSRSDEAALAALVQRHAPMVWGVCRRVLGNYHDAEDAFQATFLVLVRRAASIASPGLLANWLYGVAHQTALKARATMAKRRARERQVTQMPEPAVPEHDLWDDLQPLLDQELSRLPDIHRVVIVLCDLEGKTRTEAARQLGLPEGTVGSRLARARGLLAKRLTERGVAMSGGTLAVVLAQNVASASVPTSVVTSTMSATSLFATGQTAAAGVISAKVAALTEGMVKAMLMSKFKAVVAVVLVLGFIVTGTTVLCCLTAMAQGEQPPAVEKPVNTPGKKEKEGFTAWGKNVGGLQAGLGFRPGEKRAYAPGETVRLAVRVRNVGTEAVEFQYLEEFFVETPPTVTDGDGKPAPLGRRRVWGFVHAPAEVKLAPGKEIELAELKLEPRTATQSVHEGQWNLFTTGKFSVWYEQLADPTTDKILSKLATGKLELEIKFPTPPKNEQKVSPKQNGEEDKEVQRKKPSAKHDFTNLQRLASALENFNYPENTATTITVWCQGGGKGNSIQVTDAKALDVAAACHMIVDGHHDKKGLDVENVVIVSADGSLVRFVNIKEKFAANKASGILVNRGDLVVVLQLRKD